MKVEDILSDLIQIRTDPAVQNNTDFVNYVIEILKQNDIVYKKVPNPDGAGNNLLAGINVRELKNIKGGILLSGHMDTVGATPADWQSDPFGATIKDGKIYGRGTIDMKQFIAVVLGLIPQFKNLKLPIFLAFSCDEETNVLGVRQLAALLEKNNIRPQYALIGEATDFNLYVANRGYAGYQTIIRGVAGHAGAPELGTNAAYIAAKIISKIEDLNALYAPKGTTLNVGIIQGGIGRNAIPAEATIDWEVRYKNDEAHQQIIKEMESLYKELKQNYPKAEIWVEPKETLPAFEEKSDSRLVTLAESILNTQRTSFPYASEAGFYQALGMDTLMCGAGNPKLAHSSDEHVAIADLNRYAEFLMNLLERINGTN
ncbi:MAG: M20 family metallopeptidase [Alphaproteobacteria bacterium]|nr:M20 family metallopeptidase [Alphaproteobacteria bacterium]